MPNLTRLNSEDFMAITRAMDANRNNRIDKGEANVSWAAHNEIGNANGVAGTRETATALEKGDVFITALQPEAADKVADYFSKRNENFKKPVAEWISDAWISKEDLDLDPEARRAIDSNYDNRISSKEFAAALVSGSLTVGAARQVSQNPFNKPSNSNDPFAKPSQDPFSKPSNSQDPFGKPSQDPFSKPSSSQDPFAKPASPSHSQDPFSKPSYSNTKPATNSDPFSKPAYQQIPDSGAYLKIEMVRGMRSDFEKGQVLTELANRKDLSPREQVLLANAAVTHISSDFSRAQILQLMAANPSLSEDGQIEVAKKARELSSDFSRTQTVAGLIQNQKLGYQAQQSVIITIGTLSGDFGKSQQFLSLIQNQQLHPDNKALLLRTTQEKVSSDFSKRQIMDALF
ncbi:MAG TPA: hypothetical protein V6D23_12455 [Candidatus Obscuribacterales bacterium]